MEEEEFESEQEEPSEDLKQYITEINDEMLRITEQFSNDILQQHALLQEVGAWINLEDVIYMIKHYISKQIKQVQRNPKYMNVIAQGLGFNKGQIN